MPEGDTVHRTADRLDAALRDTVVQRADLRWPSVPDVDLSGSRTLEVVARGKHLLHRLDDGWTLRPPERQATVQYEHTLIATRKGPRILTLA